MSVRCDHQLRLKSLSFVNSEANVCFELPDKKFSPTEGALLETKVLYFPLVQSSLHSRSRNMLLDEYFELDLHLHSLVEIANGLCEEADFRSKR